jgi:transmembrane sensor
MAEHRRETLETAYRWYARVVGGELDAEGLAELSHWLSADQRHLAAYERAQILWERLGSIARGDFPDDVLAVEDAADDIGARRLRYRRWLPTTALGRLGGATAACLAIVAVVLLLFPPGYTTYATGTAQLREVTLVDGSVVVLGADSKVRVRIGQDARDVRLLAGDAFFDVARDPRRAFTVAADATRVQVTGTAFAVRVNRDSTHVAVAEGEVRVSRHRGVFESRPAPTRSLQAGERVTSSPDGLSAVSPVALGDIAAWRDGEFSYVDATLAEILADADRYYPGRIWILDPRVADLTLNLVYESDDIDGLLTNLEEALPITVSRWAGGRLVTVASR